MIINTQVHYVYSIHYISEEILSWINLQVEILNNEIWYHCKGA